MSRLITLIVFATLSVLTASPAIAETTISYQGQLQDGGQPFNGAVDMTFQLHEHETDDLPIGPTISLAQVAVSEGLLAVDLDFGEVFTGQLLWLEASVNGTPLTPRQRITAVPMALNVPAGSGSNWGRVEDDIHFIGGKVGIGIEDPAAELHVAGGLISGISENQASVNSFVSGGRTYPDDPFSRNVASGVSSFVGGGHGNSATFFYDFVAGGVGNTAGGQQSFIGGGLDNETTGYGSFIAGGEGNLTADYYSFIGGGVFNEATGIASIVAGGRSNEASGNYSLAAGRKAHALHSGAFVWADVTDEDFSSTAGDQFLIRAGGGVGIGTNAPNSQLHVNAAAGEDPLRAQADGQTALSVSSNGGVAIGGFTILTPDNGLYVAGRTGLGTALPERDLHVKQASTANGEIGLQIERSDNSNNWAFYIATSDNLGFRYNDNLVARIDTSGQFATLSDARHKTDIGPIENPLTRLLALEPAQYRMRSGATDSQPSLGLIAQQVRDVIPTAVSESEDTLGIRYNQITALNTAALIELHAAMQDDRDRVAKLEAENETLNQQLAARSARESEIRALAERNDSLEQRVLALESLLVGEARLSERKHGEIGP